MCLDVGCGKGFQAAFFGLVWDSFSMNRVVTWNVYLANSFPKSNFTGIDITLEAVHLGNQQRWFSIHFLDICRGFSLIIIPEKITAKHMTTWHLFKWTPLRWMPTGLTSSTWWRSLTPAMTKWDLIWWVSTETGFSLAVPIKRRQRSAGMQDLKRRRVLAMWSRKEYNLKQWHNRSSPLPKLGCAKFHYRNKKWQMTISSNMTLMSISSPCLVAVFILFQFCMQLLCIHCSLRWSRFIVSFPRPQRPAKKVASKNLTFNTPSTSPSCACLDSGESTENWRKTMPKIYSPAVSPRTLVLPHLTADKHEWVKPAIPRRDVDSGV